MRPNLKKQPTVSSQTPQKDPPQRLVLSRESLRQLSAEQLMRAAGGATSWLTAYRC